MKKYARAAWLLAGLAGLIAFAAIPSGNPYGQVANGCQTLTGYDTHGALVNSQVPCTSVPSAIPSGNSFVQLQATNSPSPQTGTAALTGEMAAGRLLISNATGNSVVSITAQGAHASLLDITSTPGPAINMNMYPPASPAAPGPIAQTGYTLAVTDETHAFVTKSLTAGETVDGSGNFGFYSLLWSTSLGAANTSLTNYEAVQATTNGHVGMPQDIFSGTASASNCVVGVECVQVTITFGQEFVTDVGIPSAPTCLGGTVIDTTTATQMWVAEPNAAPSATAVTYNLAPMVAITTPAHALNFYVECHQTPGTY